jgi:DNA-binding NtrC family response regulator
MTLGKNPTRAAKERILVVDDEGNARQALKDILTEEGYELVEAADGEDALQLMQSFAPAAVLADVRMPKMDGITLLKRAREQGSDAVFVMMTAYASVEAAVEAMRAGAENYLVKPLDVNAVLVVLEKALEKLRLQRDTQNLRERVRERYRFHNIVGDAPELQASTRWSSGPRPPGPRCSSSASRAPARSSSRRRSTRSRPGATSPSSR